MYFRTGTPLNMLSYLRIHLRSSLFSTTRRPPSGPKVPKMKSMGPIWVYGFEKKCLAHKVFPNRSPKSTNPARPSLTSVIGRELVYSRRYDANREAGERNGLYIDIVLGKKLSKKVLESGRFGRFWPFRLFFLKKILAKIDQNGPKMGFRV